MLNFNINHFCVLVSGKVTFEWLVVSGYSKFTLLFGRFSDQGLLLEFLFRNSAS